MARHLRSRRNPTSRGGRNAIVPPEPARDYSVLIAILFGSAAGVAAYILSRPSASAAAAPRPATAPGASTGTTPLPAPPPSGYSGNASSSIGTTSGPNGPDASASLISRLRGDDTARQTFYFQSNLYSNNVTDAIPDGIDGPVTDALVTLTTHGQSTTFGPSVLATSRDYIDAMASTLPIRVIPFTLPQDVINSVNASAMAVDSGAGPLQVNASTTNPSAGAVSAIRAAGQARPGSRSLQRPTAHAPARPAAQAVIPYAGFDRPIGPTPMNFVGSTPGYGVMIDPRGLNIGLWNAIEGPMHSPQPTGNTALDNDQNPIAGQRGGFWQGYR